MTNANRPKILLVGSDGGDFLCGPALKAAGYEVIGAHSRQEAVEKFSENRDVALLITVDCLMQGNTGTDLIGDLRQRGMKAPAILREWAAGLVEPPDETADFVADARKRLAALGGDNSLCLRNLGDEPDLLPLVAGKLRPGRGR